MSHDDVAPVAIPLAAVGVPIEDLPKATSLPHRTVRGFDPRPLQCATTHVAQDPADPRKAAQTQAVDDSSTCWRKARVAESI